VLAAQPLNPRATGVHPAGDPRLLTLVTCAELFHTDDRMVAFGHLVDRQPR
jgi:sortase A